MNRRRKKKSKDGSNHFILKLVCGVSVFSLLIIVISCIFSSTHEVENIAEIVESNDIVKTQDDGDERIIKENKVVLDSLLEVPIIPNDMPGTCITHVGYEISYNVKTHCPNWVAWELTANETKGQYPRSDDYRIDSLLDEKDWVDENAFSSSVYNRGHMCPAGDMKWSPKAMSSTFYMTNMCPQNPKLNHVWWERLEKACRRWAEQEGAVYICCGPIFDGSGESIPNSTPKVMIPFAFFKVVLSINQGKEKAIGFYYKNDDSRQTMGDAVRSVDQIEEMTGIDFFPLLDDELESRIEANANLGKWN